MEGHKGEDVKKIATIPTACARLFALSAMHFALCLLGAMPLALSLTAAAQEQKRVPRIGILLPNQPSVSPQLVKAFHQGLRELGYVEGRNIVIEYRFGEGKSDRYPDLAADLVQLNVDVIVTASTPAIEVVKNATSTIPIVMAASADPVGTGLIASLDRPGGNITGLTMLSRELSRKRLELLKETVPRISRVAVLWNPSNVSSSVSWRESQLAAQGLKM